MRFVIDQNNDGQFHWRLTGDDGADLAVSPASSPRQLPPAALRQTCISTRARRRRLRTTRCSLAPRAGWTEGCPSPRASWA
jgi:hypothetical protein